jgi:hypothetical protein
MTQQMERARDSVIRRLTAVKGNADGTVFIGRPEKRDLARLAWVATNTITKLIDPILKQHGKPAKACDGVRGTVIDGQVLLTQLEATRGQ